jgi:hypothetical protein
MSRQQEIIIIILMSLGFCGGVAFGHKLALAGLKDNQIENSPCAPITKHTSLRSAKAQVLINQKLGERL